MRPPQPLGAPGFYRPPAVARPPRLIADAGTAPLLPFESNLPLMVSPRAALSAGCIDYGGAVEISSPVFAFAAARSCPGRVLGSTPRQRNRLCSPHVIFRWQAHPVSRLDAGPRGQASRPGLAFPG